MRFVSKKWITRLFYKIANPIRRLWWFVRRPHTRGVKIMIEHDGKILLGRLGYAHQGFTMPGGGVHRNETFQQASIREAYEEVGVVVSNPLYIGEYISKKEYKTDTVHCFYYRAPSDSFKIDGIEIIEAGWFDPTALPTNHAASVSKVLDLFKLNQ